MRRWFARSFRTPATTGGVDKRRNEALISKLHHEQDTEAYYQFLNDSLKTEDAINRMVNGNEIVFFKYDQFNNSQIESLVYHFQKLRPAMGIDIDNHLLDYVRMSHDCFRYHVFDIVISIIEVSAFRTATIRSCVNAMFRISFSKNYLRISSFGRSTSIRSFLSAGKVRKETTKDLT
jgi:hypothetical protein